MIIKYSQFSRDFCRFIHITTCAEGLMLARTVSRISMSGSRSATQRAAALAKHMSTDGADASVMAQVCYLS